MLVGKSNLTLMAHRTAFLSSFQSALTMMKAKVAVNALNDWFEAKHPRVIGQTPAEVSKDIKDNENCINFKTSNQCPLQLQSG